VIYKDGVYDITGFIVNHPGGADKIMLAAGKSIAPFWHIYQQHFNSKLPMQILETLRIGNLDPRDMEDEEVDQDDPYANDPSRHPALLFHSRKPCNAETPMPLVMDNWITPTDLWYIRNHHPVPLVDPDTYELVVEGLGVQRKVYTLQDLKTKFAKRTVVSTIQCGGNRRGGIDEVKKSSGTGWKTGAISNASWGGVWLRDILKDAGLEDPSEAGVEHVQFEAIEGLQASIPVQKAVSPWGDTLVAYEMNGVEITREHGYPVRMVVPGHVGVRNVKWLSKIVASHEEARGPWQRGLAYKGFSPGVTSVKGINLENIASVQEMPVQSAIVEPRADTTVEADSEVTVRGFAWSGGGRGIVRVDVSADGGKNWHTAEIGDGGDQKINRAWAWTFWEVDVEVPADQVGKPLELCCKATDASYNVQPEYVGPIWNLRGLNNNSWHRVPVRVVAEE